MLHPVVGGIGAFGLLVAAEPGLDFTVYGVAGTTVAILLYGIKVLWTNNVALNADVKSLLQRVIEATTVASAQMMESSRAMTTAAQTVEKVTQATLSPEQINEVIFLLREIRNERRS